jgi:hypothetical protein
MPLTKTMIAVLSLTLALCQPATADRLSAAWQEQRDFYNAITHRACAGERQALEQLWEAALDNMEPVAINNLAWLHEGSGRCPNLAMTRDPVFAGELFRDSANLAYPLGMFNHGRSRFYGRNGVARSMGDGLSWLESSAMEGFAGAAEELALIYAEGRGGLAPDMQVARAYSDRADRLGLSQQRRAALAEALAVAAAQGGRGGSEPPTDADVGDEVFRVDIGAPSSRPRLGDRLVFGNTYYLETVYIAQAFDVGDFCWRASGRFLTGDRLVPGTEYTPRIFSNLLDSSAQARQHVNGLHHSVFHFTDLEEGLDFHRANPRFVGSNLTPYVYTLAEAQSHGARCFNDEREVLYPVPTYAPGY